MGSTAHFLIAADALSMDSPELWELWRLLGVRGFTSRSETVWSAGPDDDVEVTMVRRRDLAVGVDRPRYDELQLRTTSATRGAAWRFFARDLPAVARLSGAQLLWLLDDAELEAQGDLLTVHRSLRSGQLAAFRPALLAVPTGSSLAAVLAARGSVTHDSGFTVLRS